MAATNVSLKLFIDKRSQRVLYAEADKEFVDFLFSIFTLPVGVVTRLLKEGGGMAGCLPTLYQGIENMSVAYIQPDKDKQFLLQPNVVMPGAKVPLLLPNVGSTFRQLYRCPNQYKYSNCSSYVADEAGTICPKCKCKMDGMVTFIDPTSEIRASSGEEGYVKGTATYMVMDDLDVKALSSTALVSLLNKFNVKEIGDIDEKVVDVGMDEGMKLLQASLQSKTVLTDVFLPEKLLKSKNAGKGKCNAKEHIATVETSMELKITDMKSLEDYGM